MVVTSDGKKANTLPQRDFEFLAFLDKLNFLEANLK